MVIYKTIHLTVVKSLSSFYLLFFFSVRALEDIVIIEITQLSSFHLSKELNWTWLPPIHLGRLHLLLKSLRCV